MLNISTSVWWLHPERWLKLTENAGISLILKDSERKKGFLKSKIWKLVDIYSKNENIKLNYWSCLISNKRY